MLWWVQMSVSSNTLYIVRRSLSIMAHYEECIGLERDNTFKHMVNTTEA